MRTIILAATIEFGRASSQACQIPRTPRSGCSGSRLALSGDEDIRRRNCW